MQVSQLLVNITSEQPERLGKFYREVVGLDPHPQIEGAFLAGGTTFIVDGHSQVRGAAKEPQRVLLDFFVDDIAAEQTRLEKQGVSFIRDKGKEYWGGVISTFLDPDGNYCQLIEYKPQPN